MPDEHAQLTHAIRRHRRASSVAGASVVAVAHELDADEQARSAHVADEIVRRLQLAQLGQQVRADIERVRLQASRRCVTRSVASPAAQAAVLPPNVLKNSMPLSKRSAIARVVTTAPIG